MGLRLPHRGVPWLLGVLVLAGLLTGCSLSNPFGEGDTTKPNEYLGRLEAVQVTSYMYGSHVLVTREGRYAIEKAKGADIRLDDYNGRKVRVEADRVEGYPVDGGPPLLAVEKIHPLN